MQFFALAALVSSVVVASSDLTSTTPNTLPELFSRIPACANKCVAEAMPGLCPSVESYWCRCHSSVKARLVSKTFDCAMEACGGMQAALEYQEATNSVCDDIMEVTIKSQKHVELRQVGSVSGSAMPSGGSVMAGSGSVRPTGSTMRRGSSARGSGSATGTYTSTIMPESTTPAAATGAASTVATSPLASMLLGSGVAGLAIISIFGMLI